VSAEPDLLPLPRVLVHVPHEGDMEMEAVGNYYEASKVREVIATKDAEVEALRAEAERLAEALREALYGLEADEPVHAELVLRAALEQEEGRG
jgi:hypothetical protein